MQRGRRVQVGTGQNSPKQTQDQWLGEEEEKVASSTVTPLPKRGVYERSSFLTQASVFRFIYTLDVD